MAFPTGLSEALREAGIDLGYYTHILKTDDNQYHIFVKDSAVSQWRYGRYRDGWGASLTLLKDLSYTGPNQPLDQVGTDLGGFDTYLAPAVVRGTEIVFVTSRLRFVGDEDSTYQLVVSKDGGDTWQIFDWTFDTATYAGAPLETDYPIPCDGYTGTGYLTLFPRVFNDNAIYETASVLVNDSLTAAVVTQAGVQPVNSGRTKVYRFRELSDGSLSAIAIRGASGEQSALETPILIEELYAPANNGISWARRTIVASTDSVPAERYMGFDATPSTAYLAIPAATVGAEFGPLIARRNGSTWSFDGLLFDNGDLRQHSIELVSGSTYSMVYSTDSDDSGDTETLMYAEYNAVDGATIIAPTALDGDTGSGARFGAANHVRSGGDLAIIATWQNSGGSTIGARLYYDPISYVDEEELAGSEWPFLSVTTVQFGDFWTMPGGATITRDYETLPAEGYAVPVVSDPGLTGTFNYQPARIIDTNRVFALGDDTIDRFKGYLLDTSTPNEPTVVGEYTSSARLPAAIYPTSPDPIASTVFFIASGDSYTPSGQLPINGPSILVESYGGGYAGSNFVFNTSTVVAADSVTATDMGDLLATPSYNGGVAMVGANAYWATYTSVADPAGAGTASADGLTGALYVIKVAMSADPQISYLRYQLNYSTPRSIQGIGTQFNPFVGAMDNGDIVVAFGTVEATASGQTEHSGTTYNKYRRHIVIYASTNGGTSFTKLREIAIGEQLIATGDAQTPTNIDVTYVGGASASDFMLLSNNTGNVQDTSARRYVRRVDGLWHYPPDITPYIPTNNQMLFDGDKYAIISGNALYEVLVTSGEVLVSYIDAIPDQLQDSPKNGKVVGGNFYIQVASSLLVYPNV